MIDWDSKIAATLSAYRACRICPRDCGTDRTASTDGAFCGLDERAWVYKELLSFGEESSVGRTWLLDLGGCSMRCLFCTEWPHVVDPRTRPAGVFSPGWFARTLAKRRAEGAQSISLVGGDPTVSLLAILRALGHVAPEDRLPVVFNCNGWMSPLALAMLRDVVTTWTIDLKFGSDACAKRLAGTGTVDYGSAVAATLDVISTFKELRPRGLDPELPKLLIRHLLMPGHLRCCTLPVLERIASRWPAATVNLMTMYLPFGPAQRPLKGSPELLLLNTDEDKRGAISAAVAAWRESASESDDGVAKSPQTRLLIDGQPLATS